MRAPLALRLLANRVLRREQFRFTLWTQFWIHKFENFPFSHMTHHPSLHANCLISIIEPVTWAHRSIVIQEMPAYRARRSTGRRPQTESQTAAQSAGEAAAHAAAQGVAQGAAQIACCGSRRSTAWAMTATLAAALSAAEGAAHGAELGAALAAEGGAAEKGPRPVLAILKYFYLNTFT